MVSVCPSDVRDVVSSLSLEMTPGKMISQLVWSQSGSSMIQVTNTVEEDTCPTVQQYSHINEMFFQDSVIVKSFEF